ncbi:hypothetical protein CGCS363_v001882 [Colletotrichum siamense]|uniref:uncharacterized protein n=1 Tax=Colletotrichum siamense TaxID=690259 RepID=UPI0018726E30|nr:uncharacterized protein CGCS363_v001882 [Colletotrichum siamense]KAF5516954.1 hypothetical protein CGCS363_v001882 [Colletotrichum siamense]
MGNPFEDKAELGSSAPGVAPPAYTPFDTAASSSSSSATQGPFQMSPSTTPYQPFPSSMSAYYQLKITRTFHLGDSNNHKLFAVSSWSGTSSKSPGIPCIILHNGPNPEDPVLAVCSDEKNWSPLANYPRTLHSSMILPSLEAYPSGKGKEEKHATEDLRPVIFNGSHVDSFRFSIEVPQPNNEAGTSRLLREDFEWRRTSKDGLNGYNNGFELFRLKSDIRPEKTSSDVGGSEPESEALAAILFKGSLSVNKPFYFEFKGRGLTGELGDRWSVMSMMTGIRIWFLFFAHRAK